MNEHEAAGPPKLRLLMDVQDVLKRYVVMTDEQRLIVALWILHSHVVEHLEQTPYLTVTSPQRQCGKSRLLELLNELVPRPWMTITPSEPVVYRTIDVAMPTLLLDEVDAIFAPKNADRYEGLRAILNAGHRQGAKVPRCVGTSMEPKMFGVFCAKVLAGIGVLPDTITDRSIPIRLQRKTRDEHVDRFRLREVREITAPLHERLAEFGEKYGEKVGEARPDLPDELSDRMQEGCEPLLAIADAAGYGNEARVAMVKLLTGDRADERESVQLKLLASIREAFATSGAPAESTEALLMTMNGNGWGDWYGRGLNSQDLASMLRPYDVHSKTVRVGEQTKKGYHRDDFHEAWSRYLPEVTVSPDENGVVTPVTPVTPSGREV